MLVVITALATTLLGLVGSTSGASTQAPGRSWSRTTHELQKVDPALRAMLPASIRTAGVMTLGTDATYPPCEFMQGTTMVGFEPDLWNGLGRLFGVSIRVSNANLDSLIPGVKSGRYELAMECLSDLVAREQVVTFLDFGLDGSSSVTLKANSHHISNNPASLCGLSAAFETGNNLIASVKSELDSYCKREKKQPVDLLTFNSNNAALLAVYSGRAAFSLQDTDASSYLEKVAPKPVVAFANVNALIPPFYIGIVIARNMGQLQDALLAGLRKEYTDGTYASVMTKWKIPKSDWIPPGVNLAKSKPINPTL
jgi:polar amino acid transport system substrate-binding protein